MTDPTDPQEPADVDGLLETLEESDPADAPKAAARLADRLSDDLDETRQNPANESGPRS
jgi:hypothetical protein